MNKAELISAIAEKTTLPKKDVQTMLNAFFEVTHDTLAKDDKIVLPGFGTFSVANRPAHMGYNPLLKQKMEIPAKKSVKFKAGKGLDL